MRKSKDKTPHMRNIRQDRAFALRMARGPRAAFCGDVQQKKANAAMMLTQLAWDVQDTYMDAVPQ